MLWLRQHDAAMSACQARLDSAHVASLKAEHEATIGKVHAEAESAMSAHRAQLSTLQESLAQHASQTQIVQAEHEANIQALKTKHSGVIAKAQTEVDTLTAQNAAAADEALAQHEADVHALVAQHEATDHAAKEVCESEAKLRKKSEADLAQAQRTHANILLSRMSEVRAQHRSELADLQAARSNGPDTESTLAHLRAKHEEVMSTALELKENKTHDDPLLQRTGTHEPQNLCSQPTQAQPDMDHHILKLPQEGKLPSALLASICVAFVKVLATSQPACVCKGMLCNKSPSACMCCHTVL